MIEAFIEGVIFFAPLAIALMIVDAIKKRRKNKILVKKKPRNR